MLPQDPIILLSYVNTQLRDNYSSLDKLAEGLDMSARQIERIMAYLKVKGLIRSVGANRNGYWEVQD